MNEIDAKKNDKIEEENKKNSHDISIATLSSELNTNTSRQGVLVNLINEKNTRISELRKNDLELVEKEKSITAILKKIAEMERTTKNSASKKEAEEDRWKQIEIWYGLEAKKWENEDVLLKETDYLNNFQNELTSLRSRKEILLNEIEKQKTEKEIEESTNELNLIVKDRVETETELKALKQKQSGLSKDFSTTQQNESSVEKEEEGVEGLISVAKSSTEERELIKKRYSLEKERHEIEVFRWKLEEEMGRVGKTLEEREFNLIDVKKQEEEIRKKLADLNKKERAFEMK